jgi:predicted ATPase/class 3 adenylate cyclase
VDSIAAATGGIAAARPVGELSTFLITDIEGSTRLWEEHAAGMGPALAQHDRLLRAAIEGGGGTVIKTTGDGMLAVFADPVAGVDAALTAQRALRGEPWGDTGPLRVRMALHSGQAEARDGDYFGPALNRVARILAIAHGGQIVCSAVAAVLAGDRLPRSIELIDLGSHRLRDIDRPEQVFQVVAADLPRVFPPLRSLSTHRSNLPVLLTSFVGRDRELTEVATLLDRHRLVTLIGTGGTGKTRLMLEAAGRLIDRFSDGVWLAELAPLGDPAQIPSEVARALGSPEIPGIPAAATVTAFVADKDLLLLLDNAEHLVDGTARFAERLLASAPGLRILATSREALAVPGEAILQLQSLSCPTAGHRAGGGDAVDVESAARTDAVRLFTERAAAVDPTFTLTESNVTSVAEICRRLDGIPLAIELAAARVSAMSPDDIALRLGDRFRLLTGGRRTAGPRQQTLHALIDWSWDLLTDEDRRLLRRLSVFTGGWTVPIAARVVGDAPEGMDSLDLVDGLTRLIDRSLVLVDRDTMRYRMLETIRQYAREKLLAEGEAAAVADRHLAVFADLAIQSEGPSRGPGMVDWLDRLDTELDNLGSALEWGLEADPWTAVGMASALLPYWAVRVMSQDNDARIVAAVEFARADVMDRPDADPAKLALAARLIGEAARLWGMAGRGNVGYAWAVDAMRIAERSGDPQARLAALSGLTITTVFAGHAGPDGTDVRPLFDEVSTLAEALGEWWVVALSAGFAGATISTFDAERGAALLQRGIDAAHRSGSPYVIAAVSMAQGRALGHRGEVDAAAASFGVAIQRFAELGDERMVLASRSDLAHAQRRGGRLDDALAVYRETIGGWVHLGHKGAVANQLENVAYLLEARGADVPAVRLLGAADRIREAANARMAFDEEPEHAAALDRLRGAMTEAAFADAWAAGRATSQPDAVALALAA